jgi:hypothetical protein
MLLRRLSTVAVGTITAVALGVGPASAHFCFFKDPNEKAQAGRAGSQGFFTFETITTQFFGLCPEGSQLLADVGGVELDTLINAHGLMAGPTGGNKPIGHLDIEALDGALPAAFEACGMEPPEGL